MKLLSAVAAAVSTNFVAAAPNLFWSYCPILSPPNICICGDFDYLVGSNLFLEKAHNSQEGVKSFIFEIASILDILLKCFQTDREWTRHTATRRTTQKWTKVVTVTHFVSQIYHNDRLAKTSTSTCCRHILRSVFQMRSLQLLHL